MLIPISEITISPRRREVQSGDVKELADSIAEVGLINPIMVDQSHTLIAGLHRLEAMKMLAGLRSSVLLVIWLVCKRSWRR